MLGLFDHIEFTPVKTPAGPRFRIEGDAKIGRLPGVEGTPEGAAILTLRPQGEATRFHGREPWVRRMVIEAA